MDAIRPLKTPKMIRKALENLPKTLDETYERMLLTLYAQAGDSLTLLRRTFAFVPFAKRPMTVAEVAQAVVIDIGDEKFDRDAAFCDPEDLLSFCHPLVDVSSTGHLGFVHHSVREFFVSDRLANADGGIKEFALNGEACHAEISQLCLTFACFEDFAGGHCQTLEELSLRKERFPFLGYAAAYWTFHGEHRTDDAVVRNLLYKILDPPNYANLGSMLQAIDYTIGLRSAGGLTHRWWTTLSVMISALASADERQAFLTSMFTLRKEWFSLLEHE